MVFILLAVFAVGNIRPVDASRGGFEQQDSLALQGDSLVRPDSLLPQIDAGSVPPIDSAIVDTVVRKPVKPFLNAPLRGTSRDSLVFNVKTNKVDIYGDGDITYEERTPLNLKGDRMRMDLDTKDVEAWGAPLADSSGMSRPEFSQGSQNYQMDSLRFNLDSKRGLIYHSSTQQGEGWMIAGKAKIHEDKTVDAVAGQYTTCSHTDHPHFYIAMSKARVVPGKKAIFGTAHFVLEDVPIYFPFLPFGFFPLMTGPSSGFIMPSFGEEYSKGFFLRNGGYYFRLSDYMDAQVTGSIFTLGSWDARMATRYMKRYKYSGNFSFDYE